MAFIATKDRESTVLAVTVNFVLLVCFLRRFLLGGSYRRSPSHHLLLLRSLTVFLPLPPFADCFSPHRFSWPPLNLSANGRSKPKPEAENAALKAFIATCTKAISMGTGDRRGHFSSLF
uniref:Uncharacterized protein n=1 Tax=Trichuris muris TaxID=70415 RepID=A0A5S6QPY7_TRIMR